MIKEKNDRFTYEHFKLLTIKSNQKLKQQTREKYFQEETITICLGLAQSFKKKLDPTDNQRI